MGKKKRKGGRTQSQSERFAEAARRREEHVELVRRRQGDPRYVQQTSTETGRTISWSRESVEGQELAAVFEAQRRAFVEKFGRDPGPGDPVFFDPEAGEPLALSEAREAELFEEMLGSLADAGLEPAFVEAWRSLGYVVTEENRHLFSAHEVDAWDEAVEAAWGGPDSEVDDELDWDESVTGVATILEAVVGMTLEDDRESAAHRFVAGYLASLGHDEDGLAIALIFAVLLGWLTGARGSGLDPTAAMNWVNRNLSHTAAEQAFVMAGAIGHPFAADVTIDEANDELGPMVVAAMIWLAAGLAATAGGGDTSWLRQFDVGHEA